MQPINTIVQFFLELWTEINLKASLRARAETHPSLPVLNNSSSSSPSDAVDGTIFEELVQQYEKLVTRTEDMIVQQVCTEVEAAWKTHFARCAPAHSCRKGLTWCFQSGRCQQYSLEQFYFPDSPSSSLYFVIAPHCFASHSSTG
jgi:hypothetical protein